LLREIDMMGWGDGHGWMGFGWIFMLVFWGLIIAGVIALARWLLAQGTGARDAPGKKPLDILKERYARGEIERDEFEQKRRDLQD
jgi:putative membrane protein